MCRRRNQESAAVFARWKRFILLADLRGEANVGFTVGSQVLKFFASRRKTAQLQNAGDGARATVLSWGGSLRGLARPPSETSSEDGAEEEDASGVLCSHQIKLGVGTNKGAEASYRYIRQRRTA